MGRSRSCRQAYGPGSSRSRRSSLPFSVWPERRWRADNMCKSITPRQPPRTNCKSPSLYHVDSRRCPPARRHCSPARRRNHSLEEGSTAAYDMHWQALAKKWDFALLGPSYHVLHQLNDLSPGSSQLWFDPRRGSEKAFLKALRDLGGKSDHPELETIPWALWGHSGGGIWADVMNTLHSDRVVAMWLRSGSVRSCKPMKSSQPQVPAAAYANPIMLNPGVKEKATFEPNPKGKEKGPWYGNLATFHEYEPRTPSSASRRNREPTTNAATRVTWLSCTLMRAWRCACRTREAKRKP